MKGFVYSLFAIAVMGVLAVTMVLPMTIDADMDRRPGVSVDELYYFVEAIRADMGRAVEISGRRAMVAVGNTVVNSGAYLDRSAGPAIAGAFYNGSFNSSQLELLQDSALDDWVDKMEDQAAAEGYDSNLTVAASTVNVTEDGPFGLRFAFRYDLSVYDPVIDTGFNRTDRRFTAPITTTDMEDPLLFIETAGQRSRTIRRCSVDPADQRLTGTMSDYNRTYAGEQRDWVGGVAHLRPGSVSGLDAEDVAVLEDHCVFPETELDDLAGVVSAATDTCDYAGDLRGLVAGAGNISRITDGRRTVLDGTAVWQLGIPAMIRTGCFVPDPEGPGYLDRLEGVNGPSSGIASLLDVPALPPEVQRSNATAVDHGFFGVTTGLGPAQRIKGVTSFEEDWFRLDQQHIEQWDIESLAYAR